MYQTSRPISPISQLNGHFQIVFLFLDPAAVWLPVWLRPATTFERFLIWGGGDIFLLSQQRTRKKKFKTPKQMKRREKA